MKFIKLFFASAVVTCLTYFGGVLLLIDSPVQAEYWVGEMIAIKKELTKNYAGKTKIIIAGGSSALFGIDAEYASRQLNIPVINFGLHAGLRLEKILQEVNSVVEPNDILVLSLEPTYYDCQKKLTAWQVDNIIGWDHDAWEKMSYIKKAEFVSLVSPSTFGRMIVANFQRSFFPTSIKDRLNSLDNALVLSKFRTRSPPLAFEYSAYHLDNHGDMLRTEGAYFKGSGWDESEPKHVCTETASELNSFVNSMKKKGVIVFFANTPYIASGVSTDKVRNDEISFQKEFINNVCFIDKREDLMLDRKYFFNTSLHLNAEGRTYRTDLFINSMQKNILTGTCQHPLNP
ncbi:hypothetical protein [Methylotenera sp.]|uniref:hypothetical protein n=1 Tax=Methylotenera sp. TaxID=2051956 RepID=UPI00272F7ACE|nr:hypothetical protein [Methylotenera sp.]MDP2231496.1 hypothetical protein [Methylotenera sp.]